MCVVALKSEKFNFQVAVTVKNINILEMLSDSAQFAGFRKELASREQALSLAKAGALLRFGLSAGDRLRR